MDECNMHDQNAVDAESRLRASAEQTEVLVGFILKRLHALGSRGMSGRQYAEGRNEWRTLMHMKVVKNGSTTEDKAQATRKWAKVQMWPTMRVHITRLDITESFGIYYYYYNNNNYYYYYYQTVSHRAK